jgi:hypothetical protein
LVESRLVGKTDGIQILEGLPAMGAFLLLTVQLNAVGGGERGFDHVGDGDVQVSSSDMKPQPILFIDSDR